MLLLLLLLLPLLLPLFLLLLPLLHCCCRCYCCCCVCMRQVLLDIIIRQVQDMEPDDTRRCLYLDLLRVTILHSQWADRGYYRKDHVIAALESIFAESGEHPGVWSVVCICLCVCSSLPRCLCRVCASLCGHKHTTSFMA